MEQLEKTGPPRNFRVNIINLSVNTSGERHSGRAEIGERRTRADERAIYVRM